MIEKEVFEKIAEKFETPTYVYDGELIKERLRVFPREIGILYAMKANSNPYILRLLLDSNPNPNYFGVDAVSLEEIAIALRVGVNFGSILFTGTSVSDEELDWVMRRGVLVNVESFSLLNKLGKKYKGADIFVRINPLQGAGHHPHCITAGPESKFGIWPNQIPEFKKLAKKYDFKIIGAHQHIGSQILDEELFISALENFFKIVFQFRDVKTLRFVDIGGGFGVPYQPGDKPLNMECLLYGLLERFRKFCKEEFGRELTLIVEPGRYLVAESGFLLVKVTKREKKPDGKIFIGVDSGFNHLVRPAMYGSYHEIENISKQYSTKKEKVIVVGNLCESGDKFSVKKPHLIAKPEEGDLLIIKNAGAYGFSMSSNYNSRRKPAEVLCMGRDFRLIRKRETLEEVIKFPRPVFI